MATVNPPAQGCKQIDTQLVPSGDTGAQTAALTVAIRQASAWADQIVYGATGIIVLVHLLAGFRAG